MSPRKKPSENLPAARPRNLRLTDQDRAMLARRQNGETRKAVAAEFAVSIETVRRAEWRGRMNAEGREMLADDPQRLYGLCHVGELDWGAAHILRCHHYHFDGPELTRLSDVAAVGRGYVQGLESMGPKRLAELDSLLERHGLKWNPKAQPLRPWRQEPGLPPALQQRVETLIESIRAGFLRRYRASLEDRNTTQPKPLELETAGNLICLPGVALSDVLGSIDGGRP